MKNLEKKLKKVVDKSGRFRYNKSCATEQELNNDTVSQNLTGVWLSLARAPGLGPGGRRFESCHPDAYMRV